MTYVKKDGWTLHNASDNFRKYKEIVMATVKKKVQIGSSRNREIMTTVVKQNV